MKTSIINGSEVSRLSVAIHPHPDFGEIFSDNVHYHLDIAEAINSIEPELLSVLEEENNWFDDDTRSL